MMLKMNHLYYISIFTITIIPRFFYDIYFTYPHLALFTKINHMIVREIMSVDRRPNLLHSGYSLIDPQPILLCMSHSYRVCCQCVSVGGKIQSWINFSV